MGFSKDFLESQSDDEKKRLENYFSGLSKGKKQSPANALTEAICKYVRACGGVAARINVMGVYDSAKGMYRTSGSTKGVEDVTCIKPMYVRSLTSEQPVKVGMVVAVEVKIGKDKQSDKQIDRQKAVESAGGRYIIAKTFDQFKVDWDKISIS